MHPGIKADIITEPNLTETNKILSVIRNELFYGSADYTKSQPDLFIPHRFKILAPSQADSFLEKVKESLIEEEDILLYVHLPFCFSECLFCNSFPHKTDRGAQNDYLSNLLKEIELFSNHGLFKGKKARYIYFGGGTPTSFSNHDIKLILDKLSSCIDLSENCSITSEAHPSTLSDKNRIRGLGDIGITRLSIGCQTFDQKVLLLCNRKNTGGQVERIVRDVQDAGISINIDMMTGLPGQTIEGIKKDLEILAGIRPDSVEYIRHEIVNPLVVKLYKDNPALVVSNDTLFEMVCITQEWMSANGYEQNGRFTDDKQWGYRYHWLREMPIIAFGSRARSYTKTICFDKHEELSAYSDIIRNNGLPIGRYISLTEREQMYRSLLLNIQVKRGLDIKQFHDRFSADPLDIFSSLFSKLSEYGCLKQEDGAINLTKYGAYFVEDICDYIIDAVLKEESNCLVRAPHSEGGTSSRL
ncbi:MAG: radical SAM domain-containing protein [Nitrospirae bacterium]|nr:MAG: radical SAM domain-containing protein [Nitrospirota bacterium]